ncbi:hypothetical protein DFR24_0419 [Panacagrimonas perspica]|uniref:Uncharacterized protein n=1 Tax=Panacagrimonas perspica TaxID=381431 RepID=A0A4R7PC24_9GAMM|nr:hypothetical protein [Panacagrimonas perspica]TDU31061.1 hypothetical protein DFR24_0419 [Panacagrimonas perspica]THD01797.1 hypothetical protein B1810_17470 [Panacagrimonas perspica]
MDAASRFHVHFVAELKAEGRDGAFIARHTWRPTPLEFLRIFDPERDLDLAKLEYSAADVDALPSSPPLSPMDADFHQRHKLALVVVPGFTHETLRNYSWHEQIQRRDSPHHVVMLHAPQTAGGPLREQEFGRGDGMKVLYLRYPRSNADSRHIVPTMFSMLTDSTHLRRWIADGYRLVFVGYSYGAPLSLELLAAMNSGALPGRELLSRTVAFVGMCGDIGGSYLADDVMHETPRFFSMRRLIAFCARHPLIAKLVGLGTPQLLADMEGGVQALGHEVRQTRLREYAPQLPPELHYFSIAAVMPLADYRRRWWQFNLDDYALYRQALITDAITVYNDGQVALPDNLIPEAAQIPPQRRLHLGAVRTHHWGVSYLTFNFGRNRFPRPAFYRALIRTIAEHLSSP